MKISPNEKIIEIGYKGFPLDSYGKSVADFLSNKPNIFNSGFQFPLMVLKQDALTHNIDKMSRFCKSVGAELAPHVKTTMAPQIAQLQIDAGAFAVTVASLWQAEIFREFDFKKIIIANEVLDQYAIKKIAELNKSKQVEIIFYVDSLEGLEIIKSFTPSDGIQNLFIEIGTINGRGGVRNLELVKEIAMSIHNKFNQDKILLLRSGGYVTHDNKYYEDIYPFKSSSDGFLPAIEIWAQVISKPEDGFGVLNLGKRDVGSDLHNPIPILRFSKSITEFSGEIEKLNDQHAFLKSSGNFKNADLIGLGISHPCTTFDKWRLIPLVNSNYDVVDCIHTFF